MSVQQDVPQALFSCQCAGGPKRRAHRRPYSTEWERPQCPTWTTLLDVPVPYPETPLFSDCFHIVLRRVWTRPCTYNYARPADPRSSPLPAAAAAAITSVLRTSRRPTRPLRRYGHVHPRRARRAAEPELALREPPRPLRLRPVLRQGARARRKEEAAATPRLRAGSPAASPAACADAAESRRARGRRPGPCGRPDGLHPRHAR
jgi:hypothetical protein